MPCTLSKGAFDANIRGLVQATQLCAHTEQACSAPCNKQS